MNPLSNNQKKRRPMKQSKIFYLDDDNDLLELFANNIQEWGFQVDTCNDPHKAFENLSEHASQYDVLLIDYMMPLINGIDFLYLLHEKNYFGVKQNLYILVSVVFYWKNVNNAIFYFSLQARAQIFL